MHATSTAVRGSTTQTAIWGSARLGPTRDAIAPASAALALTPALRMVVRARTSSARRVRIEGVVAPKLLRLYFEYPNLVGLLRGED